MTFEEETALNNMSDESLFGSDPAALLEFLETEETCERLAGLFGEEGE